MDLFGDPSRRDKVSEFVQLLWEKGLAHEKEVMESLDVPFVDLSPYSLDEKERLTYEAIEHGEPLIYSARISADDLLGGPDLLRREEDGYVAGDIKSGSGEEGHDDEAKLKKHYGVQVALYTDILEQRGVAGSRRPFIWDVHGEEVPYDLDESQGKRSPWTIWGVYQEKLALARGIAAETQQTTPAYSGGCKLCHWHTACIREMEAADDLTLLPELGRARRDAIAGSLHTVTGLAMTDVDRFIDDDKTVFQGVGAGSLRKFQDRARLVKTPNAVPYLRESIELPTAETELFFDIEVDPMRDVCYLHGFVERLGGDDAAERYVAFFTDTASDEEEERAFAEAWAFVEERQPRAVYYYAPYEKTWWRKLQDQYPSVCTEDDVEGLFEAALTVDLYTDVVRKATEWPTRDHSIKTLAKFLDFKWRDPNPSGAASIEWFHRWTETGDPKVKQRILDYNEDDCVATRVVLDGIRELQALA
jgi:predicted RecB family nuclease